MRVLPSRVFGKGKYERVQTLTYASPLIPKGYGMAPILKKKFSISRGC